MAQETIELLRKSGFLCNDYPVTREGEHVFIPIRSSARHFAKKQGLALVSKKLEPRVRGRRAESLSDLLCGKLTQHQLSDLGSSFDIIGDIAVLELAPSLQKKEKTIASAILSSYKHVKVVAKKASGTGGKFRIRPITVIAGERRTSTICAESGCKFAIDINKAYYTPRFATERMRLAGLVQGGENVLVLFSGIAPYAIITEKHAKCPPSSITCVELNPSAHKMAQKNVILNKCRKIMLLRMDAKKFLSSHENAKKFDRIIMPHPSASMEFLPGALSCLAQGGTIHLYSFGNSKGGEKEIFSQAQKIASMGSRRIKLLYHRMARPFSAKLSQFALDIEAD